MGFIGVMLFVASAFAARSVLQGNVEDAKGHPIQGADIRIEAKNTRRSTQLNFQLKHKRASVVVTKGKHWVWVSAFTGSRLPGRWVEVDDSAAGRGKRLLITSYGLIAKELQWTVQNRSEGK